MSAVLLFGNLRSSLTLARKLARAGHAVHVGCDQDDPYLTASNCVAGAFRHAPPDTDPEGALRDVDSYLAAHPEIDTLAPVSEIAARLISRVRARYEGRLRLLVAPAPVVEACVDKDAMFALCDRLGVPVAARETVTDHAGLLEAIERIGRPCIVKPLDAAFYLFGRKAIILREGDDVSAALPAWPAEHAALCVQEFIEGPRHAVMFAAREGRLIGAVDMEARRTDEADGTGHTTELLSRRAHPVVRHALESLVASLGYTGVGDMDIMVDEARGRFSFLELNPRLGATYKCAEVCGLPMSTLMLELGTGGAPAHRADPWAHPAGVRVVWSKGDLIALKRDVKAGRLGFAGALRRLAVLLGAAVSRHHLTLDLRDPGPSLWIYLHPLLRRLGLRPRQEAPSAGPALEQLVGDGERRGRVDLVPAG